MEPLNQNLGEFFNTANSGSAPGRADPAAPSAPSGLPGFFAEKPPILKSSSVIPTSTVDAVASTEGLTPQQRAVMGALLGQESNNGANAVTSINGARGAGQIMPATFRRYAKPGESIDNPDSNLAVMARIVKDLGTKFADDPARIATGYFSGDGNVNAAGATPWVTDHADGNGKRVSSYVADVLKRVEGIGTPAAPAAEAPAAPDLSKAPKWADVVAKPAFQSLSDTDKAQAKQAYYDHWVAPHVDRSQRNALRDQFLAKKDEAPGMVSRAASAVSNAIDKVSGEGVGGNVDPMTGIDPSGQDSATGPAQTPTDPALGVMQNAPDRPASTIAVAPLFRQHFENAYNAATPEQRKALESLPGVMGDLAKERNTQFAAAPATSPIDPRAEARAQRLAENGMDPALTASWAKTAAARGVAPGDEVGSVSKTDFDFDAQKKFNEDPFYANPVVRAAVKGVEGYKQGVLGINQFVAEAIGADQAAQGQASMAKDSRKFTAAIGEGKTYGGRMFEGAVSSIAQQLPALLGGAVTGSEAVVLSSMFAQSFGQEYGEGRSRGQTSGEATMRAAQFAALEVIGEKFGLKESLAGIKAAAKGNIDEAVRQMVKAGTKEVPGEELTTVGQFGVDKQGGGIGLNTEAGLKDLVQQMADTFVQTVMQTGLMAGGAKTGGAAVNVVNSPERQIANEINRAADAFGNTQVTARPGPDIKTGNEIDPAATRMPAEAPAPAATPVPEAAFGNTPAAETQPAVPAAAQPVTELPKAATPTAQPNSTVANQDVLDYAEMRHAALLAKRDGQTVEHIGEDGKPAQVDQPGVALTADEQAELTALETNGGNPQALAKFYGLDIGSSIDAAAHEAAPSPKNDLPEPTPAQKEAGNYKKGHVLLQGLDISIENPQGSTRSGTDPNGKAWSIDLAHHYGYIKRTEGADGDQVDVFVGPNPDSGKVFVVDQISPSSGKFDEHKVMLGFDSKEAADAGYHANYEQGWTGRGALTEMSMDQFKTWLKTGNTKKPLAKPKTEKEAQALRSIDRDPKNGYARVNVGGKQHFVTPYDDHFVIRESTGSIAKSDEGVQLRFKSEADAIAYANSNSKRAQPKPVAEAVPLAKPKTEKEAKARRQENAANVPQPAQVPQKTDAAPAAQSTPPVAEKVKPKTEKEAIAQREAKVADVTGTPELQALLNRAIKEKNLKIGNARAQLFREGVIDAMKGAEPQKARTSYIEGHTWAMAALGKPVVSAKQDALFAEPPKTEKQAKAKRKAKKTSSAAPEADFAINQEQPDYNDPYEHTEVRPDTNDTQRSTGRAAVRDLAKRLAGHRAAGIPISILGSRLLADFTAGRPNQLVGQVAESPADLAILAQVYRDPRFETFRAIYTEGGKIVGEAGYTSRLPASVALPRDLDRRIAADMQRFKADGYYVMHNHPGGSARPSPEDVRLTEHIAKTAPGFRGHVVIDHNEYAVIAADGTHQVIQDETLNAVDFTDKPELEHRLLGVRVADPRAVADLAKALQVPAGHAALVFTTTRSKVQLIADLPMAALRDTSRPGILKGKALLRRMTRETGSGGHRFIVLPDGAAAIRLRTWLSEGVFTDVVSADGASLRERGAAHPGDFMGQNRKFFSVGELDKEGYGVTESPAFKKWFGDSKVVDADGKPLVVYRGEHGASDGQFHSRLASLSFGSREAANSYATSPNDRRDTAQAPRVMPAYIRIENPIIDNRDDPFIDLPILIKKLGRDEALRIALKFDEGIQNTGNWEENYAEKYKNVADLLKKRPNELSKLYFDAYRYLDDKEEIAKLKAAGFDGGIHLGNGETAVEEEYRVFSESQVKSAIGNNGEYRPDSPNILNESQDAYSIPAATKASQKDLVKEFGKPRFKNVDRWDRSVGTQLNKAMKEPHYKKVFDIAVDRENAISLASIRPSELAPAFLPRVDDFKSAAKTLVLGRKKNKQMLLATDALVSGTLAGGKVLEGKVWSETELRKDFGMDDVGIAHYRQARAAIDASLDEVAAAEGYAALQMFIPRSTRDAVIRDPANAETILTAAIDKRIALEKLILKKAKTNGAPKTKLDSIETEINVQNDARTTLLDVFTKAKALKEAGYTPLMRFGKFKVTVEEVEPGTGKMRLDENGQPNTLYFGRFETEGEAQAEYYRQSVLYRDRADISVKAGPTNDEQYRMYSGLSPETLALFAEEVGSDTVMKTLYQVAVSERSSLKRRLERKNIAGFSQDMPRILANFITSNGRFAAQRYYTRDLNNAIKYIPRDKADVQKEAQRLKDFLDNPKDGGASASSVAFVWFLGGNIASAAVNATQPFMMTAPYLTQWGSAQAGVSMVKALPYALGKKQITDPLLRDALKRASQEGKVDAQEIFHLYSVGVQGVVSGFTNQAGKIPLIGNKIKGSSEDIRARLSALGTLWGMPFAMVEGFNRRLTFFAAWDVAKATGQADPYAFAVRAVDETQGVYNKVNRPNWARSGPGRVIMTFAQYKIAYVELISRMWKKGGPDGKKAAAFMMAVLILASGINGLPYADDIDDLIDTVGQLFGRNTNMKRNKRKWAYDTLGKFWGDLTLYGVSSKLPLDFSGRLGLGNMLPGTALLKPSDEQGRNRQIAELFGPLAGIGGQVGDAYDAATSGNLGKMGEALAPTAIKNALAGLDMAEKGQATDYKGRKTVDVGLSDAVIKGIGFNPTVIAENTRKNMPVRQDIALLKNVESDIVEMWARGAAENKPELMDKARKKRDDWNDTNPDTPIQVTGRQIVARAKQMATSRDVRTMKAAPRDVRSEVARQLEE